VPTANPDAEKLALLGDVRAAVEGAAPGSAIAVEQRSFGDIRLAGLVAPPETRAGVLEAVIRVAGIRAVDISGLVDATYGAELVGAPVGEAGARLTWDPAIDFVDGADAPNPGPDSNGNDGVWGYRYDETSAADGYAHDPATYELMPALDSSMWTRPGFIFLIVGKDAQPGVMRLHPFGGRVVSAMISPVLEWRSPVTGFVHVTGSFSVGDPSCNHLSTGIHFRVDRGGSNLYTSVIKGGDSAAFAVWTRVSVGESVYLMVDPGEETACDTTLLRLKITSR
jgi:hypothetical protein